MLNELYSIYRGLEAVGEEAEVQHPTILEPGLNNTTFRVMLNERGEVETVRLLGRQDLKEAWSQGNKQNQFPAIKVKKPLLLSEHARFKAWRVENAKPTVELYKNLIAEVCREPMPQLDYFGIWPDYRNSIASRKELLSKSTDCQAVFELFNRYCSTPTGVEILEGVRDVLVAKCLEGMLGVDECKAACELLFGEKLKPNKDEVEDSARVTLLLDCFSSSDVEIYATSKRNVQAFSKVLFQNEDKEEQTSNGYCSVSGTEGQLVDGPFPEEKLAVLGPTIIFAKNDETSGPTVARYGQAKADGIALSKALSHKLAASISHISRDDYQGKLWDKLPNGSLLLAFCHNDINAAITPIITGDSELEDFEDYIDAADSVISSFTGTRQSFDSSVDFIEFIKVDKANRKVNFSSSTRLSDLRESVLSWKSACTNTPDFKLLIKSLTGGAFLCSPTSISPKQIIGLTQSSYIRSGDEMVSVIAVSFADSLKLLLGTHADSNLLNLLQRVTSQFRLLFERVSLSKSQYLLGAKKRIKPNLKLNVKALNASTLVAVLLFQLGRTKDVYMTDFAYQLGQLCAAMDELHIGYCQEERKGEIPNSLLGNQAYGMALNNPEKALEFMSMRRKPYDQWAKRSMSIKKGDKDKAILAAYGAYGWMKRNAEQLREQFTGMLTSDGNKQIYRAELMLGYLAGRPFEQIKHNEEQSKGEIK